MFKGRCVVITGASQGLGAELALQLSDHGAKVVLAARGRDKLEIVAKQCRQRGIALVVPTDIGDENSAKELIQSAVKEYGEIYGLILNAGINMSGKFEDVTDLSIYDKIMRVNFLGAVYVTHAAVPHLKDSKGVIGAISSLSGLFGPPGQSGYAASKAAMNAFYSSIRTELKEHGVHVYIGIPGMINTGVPRQILANDGRSIAVDYSQRDATNNSLTSQYVANMVLQGMILRRRETVFTWLGWLGQWLRLLIPGVVDALAQRKMKKALEDADRAAKEE